MSYHSLKEKEFKECPICGGPMGPDDLYACAKCRKRLEQGK